MHIEFILKLSCIVELILKLVWCFVQILHTPFAWGLMLLKQWRHFRVLIPSRYV
jgi:hypothetical protein